MQLINTTPGKNDFYLKNIAKKCDEGKAVEPLTCNIIGVLSADRTGGIFCTTPCGREYRVNPSEKKMVEQDTQVMLKLWYDWARARIVAQRSV